MYQGYGHIRDEPILWFTTWRATNSKIQYFENEKGHRTVFFLKKKNIMSDSKVQYFGRFKNQYFEEKKSAFHPTWQIQQLNILKDRGPIFFVSNFQFRYLFL